VNKTTESFDFKKLPGGNDNNERDNVSEGWYLQ